MIVINNKLIVFLILMITTACTNANEAQCIPHSVVFNDIMNCYVEDYKKYDRKLNNLYQKKRLGLSKVEKIKLQSSQKKWIQLKEEICIADEENYGRESHFDAMICQIEMTQKRIIYLERY